MALTATGYLSSPAYGLRMDLHEGMTDTADLAELHRFGKTDQGELYVLDVPRYDYSQAGNIGSAILMADTQDGLYEAYYDFADTSLDTWGHKGLMTEVMHTLLQRLMDDQDKYAANTVEFSIPSSNAPSIGLAKKLGAKPSEPNSSPYQLSLADYRRHRARRLVVHG